MFIHYTRYEDKYFDDLKEITLTSFTLTSFNTDKKIPHAKAKQIAWELWCKPVLLSDKKKYCAVALLDEKAIGYIIYGANAFYSKILGIKIGSIILTAVHKKYQGKHKIGQTLLQYVLNIYDKFNIRFITVGTDMDNAPAFLNYIKSQFLPVLFWSTFRFYPEKKIKRTDDVTIIEDPKISEKQLEQFNRPLSFLMDKRVPVSKKKKLEQANRKKIRADITDRKIQLFHVYNKKKSSALISIVEEKKISEIFGKKFFRINDILFLKKEISYNIHILEQFISELFIRRKDIFCIEIFVRSNDWPLIRVLESSSFHLIHHAVTLHRYIK